jgi:predicted nucleic acid-binding Zn ribbon protein
MSARHRHKRRGDRAARHERVRQVADVLKQYRASPFQFEAPCRYAIRAQLCLEGWDWHAADQEAHQLVQAALDLIGARRPSWSQGQPEWAQEGVRADEPLHCKRCSKVLPEGHKLWCSHTCYSAARADRMTRDEKERRRIASDASQAAWRARQPYRSCEECGKAFKPAKQSAKDQRFCSRRCANRNIGNREYRQGRTRARG